MVPVLSDYGSRMDDHSCSTQKRRNGSNKAPVAEIGPPARKIKFPVMIRRNTKEKLQGGGNSTSAIINLPVYSSV